MAPSACAYGHHDRKRPIFHVISLGYKVHISVSARRPHEMISRAASKQFLCNLTCFDEIITCQIFVQNLVLIIFQMH